MAFAEKAFGPVKNKNVIQLHENLEDYTFNTAQAVLPLSTGTEGAGTL